MTITIDLYDAHSPCGAVHIRNKTAVGTRLALGTLAAMASAPSGRPGGGTAGPTVNGHFSWPTLGILGARLPLSLRSVAGMTAAGASHANFEITNLPRPTVPTVEWGGWEPVQSVVVAGTEVTLRAEDSTAIVKGIRYAWGDVPSNDSSTACLNGKFLYDDLNLPMGMFIAECAASRCQLLPAGVTINPMMKSDDNDDTNVTGSQLLRARSTEAMPPVPAAVLKGDDESAAIDRAPSWPVDKYGMMIPVQSGRSLAELVPVYYRIAATKREHGDNLPIVVQAEPCCFPLYHKEAPPFAPADYLPAVQAMRDAGVTVVWYVPTLDLSREKEGEYCCSPLHDITHWINQALKYHNATHTGTMLDGIFLDNGPANQFMCPWGRPCSNFSIYDAMYRHVQQSASPRPRPVIMNSGLSYFDEAYLRLPNLMMLAFESTPATWGHTDWVIGGRSFNWSQYQSSRFAMVTEGVANLSAAIATIEYAASLHYGNFYCTPATADYSKLPPYWEAMAAHISAMNTKAGDKYGFGPSVVAPLKT